MTLLRRLNYHITDNSPIKTDINQRQKQGHYIPYNIRKILVDNRNIPYNINS